MQTRSGPRVKLLLTIVSEIDKQAEQNIRFASGNVFEVNVFDISIVGAGIFTKNFLPKGCIINMKIDGAPFGLKKEMEIKGEVRYCKYIKLHQYKCGIKFLDLAEEHQETIKKFISAYERRKDTRLRLPE
ncbi:MAG: PilZ domain-containing protein [Candidatus Omnitrophota bacterium]|nr:PilZ domain-containing protein [Candidatus Omnitrophota bacterium]